MDPIEKDSLETFSNDNDEIDIVEAEDIPEINEESQFELEKIEKIKMEKKKFLEEQQKESKMDNIEPANNQPISHRMKFLLDQAEVFAHFVLSKNENVKRKKITNSKKHRALHDEKDEDSALIKAEKEAFDEPEDQVTRLVVQPSILKGGTLRNYQMNGLNWLISLYENGINGILADEMGLGKTIQTISLIAFLKEFKRIHGPFLIIGPKSTLGNWMREFKKWLPCVRLVKLVATKNERNEIIDKYLKSGKFDVCLTSYEGVNICKSALMKFTWKYIMIDEAHRIKNEASVLSRNLRDLNTLYKLLITGTPLQNNLHELWSLLNFLLPDLFSSSDLFDQWFEMSSNGKITENSGNIETDNLEFINQLHKILKPFLLRRTKSEVEKTLPPKKEIHLFVGLTEQQVTIYRSVLSKKSFTPDKKFYLNLLMQLRKVCNHPYLFEGVEEEGLPALGQHLINVSGKMIILDKLLQKLKKEKHQILIFSQMTRMLDILEDYCLYREYNYCRIDGDTDMDSRDRQITEFTDPESDKFIFLLSTRAGGLGINLATADTVILFDSDWNPQVDLQAMDRAHRIGQKNQVNVYRMICENTLEEKIIERQMIKLKWDTLVIQQGRFQNKARVFTKDELKDMIQYGASEIFRSSGNNITDEDIEILLKRGEEKTEEQNKKLQSTFDKNKNILDLALINLDIYTFDNVNYQKKKKEDEMTINEAYIRQMDAELSTRTRNKYATLNQIPLQQQKQLKDEKQKLKVKVPEFRFHQNRERLLELLTKESDILSRIKTKKPNTMDEEKSEEKDIKMDEEIKDKQMNVENEKLNESQDQIGSDDNGLTPEEKNEKEYLLRTGFNNWNKIEFQAFLQGCERYSRKDYKKISEHIGTKTSEEVEQYSRVFWERISEIPEYQKIQKNIERGENSLQNKMFSQNLVDQKCSSLKNPKEELEFNTVFYNKSRSKSYSLDHDKYLIYICFIERFGNWDRIRMAIKNEPKFRFDHFFKSRTDQELLRRVQSLIRVLEKEKEANGNTGDKVNANTNGIIFKNDDQKSSVLKQKYVIDEVDEDESFAIKKKLNNSDGKLDNDDKEVDTTNKDKQAKSRESKSKEGSEDKYKDKENKGKNHKHHHHHENEHKDKHHNDHKDEHKHKKHKHKDKNNKDNEVDKDKMEIIKNQEPDQKDNKKILNDENKVTDTKKDKPKEKILKQTSLLNFSNKTIENKKRKYEAIQDDSKKDDTIPDKKIKLNLDDSNYKDNGNKHTEIKKDESSEIVNLNLNLIDNKEQTICIQIE